MLLFIGGSDQTQAITAMFLVGSIHGQQVRTKVLGNNGDNGTGFLNKAHLAQGDLATTYHQYIAALEIVKKG